ncbi:MAG: hypothetical protein BJ554DRAFT_8291 [Olpidium bornovanus]|uniref:Uncharacterized protein n=1 Tax=Olpidium bornovanus TaxID=278681 RepID=A0A8H8DIQ1_9FUNG|nr:MAG: hypothetical protein BJ554DRAFT_8291 [Olpidium bornovanus]
MNGLSKYHHACRGRYVGGLWTAHRESDNVPNAQVSVLGLRSAKDFLPVGEKEGRRKPSTWK